MSVTAKKEPQAKSGIWWLASGATYRRNHDGDFSPSSLVSKRAFGWERDTGCFVYENTSSLSMHPMRQTMPMPIELAEIFLLRCREGGFYKRMLAPFCDTRDPAKEVIEYDTFALEVQRTRDVGDAMQLHAPKLLLTLRGQQPIVGFVLCDELRRMLGRSVAKVSEEVIREHLRV